MTFERSHFCDEAPRGCGCTIEGGCSFVNVYIFDFATTKDDHCRSLNAAVRFEAEFCPWCGERIREAVE